MTEDKIVKLFKDKGLGEVRLPILPVSGGFMHRMYKVDTGAASYAVKQLNPNIMKRPDAMDNMRQAEALEAELEKAGIPIVPALILGGKKMQTLKGDHFYVFQWQEGAVTDPHHISAEQCRMAGQIQGRIHAISPKRIPKEMPEMSAIRWSGLIKEAEAANPGLGKLLKENEDLLLYAEGELNRARAALPEIECIVDEDMDPKNVMWHGGEPKVIDLECLERGNPVSGVLQLSLQWAGSTIGDLDLSKLKAFFDGYLEAYDNGFRDYCSVFGLAYTWVEWLEYNIRRALGECADEKERELGLSETELTISRIQYLRGREKEIRQALKGWFGQGNSTG